MDEKIYFRDLWCYQHATDEIKKHKLYSPDRCFDLAKLPNTWIVFEMDDFIMKRGMKLTPLSMRADLYPYNLLCSFLCDEYPDIQSFLDVVEAEMVQRAKVWLLKNGKNLIQKKYKTASGKVSIEDSDLIKYIRKIYKCLKPEPTYFDYDSDRWYLATAPMEIKVNPSNSVGSISFDKILQPKIKDEIKRVIYIHLSDVALGTVCAEITAINRFSNFLADRYPEVESLIDIDRELFELYLVYINTEATGRKSYSKELCHLRRIFITAGKILENKELENLFFRDDIGKIPENLYKVYSDEELKRLNAAIVEGDEQIARVLILHQLLGTRISETLTLKQNAVREDRSGALFICIQQVKTGKTYEKAINQDVKKLFDRSCEYTQERHGDRRYVFVNDKDPDKPMQYTRIQYHLMAMIQKNNLRDDNGELYGVGTHIWRHCYGKRLTEMHVDDITIAKLMGHANTSSLKYYRKIGNRMLADETRDMRTFLGDILRNIISDWE